MAMPVHTEVRYLKPELRHATTPPDIGDRESRRANTVKRTVQIHDARSRSDAVALEANGFVLESHTPAVKDFYTKAEVESVYYPEMHALLRRVTGADKVYTTQHVVRTENTSDFNLAYARFVHTDYSLKKPRKTAEKLLKERGENADQYSHFAWYNTWQPIERRVYQNPLAVIDATSLESDDIVDYYYTGYGKKTLTSMPVENPAHRFYYFSQMRPNEVLIIKQLDTRAEMASCCPHTSFVDPDVAGDVPGRRSIEVRQLCAFR
tara:strand:+ start:385 stop:1176 length:792 start_codon:yes stop_codon:yes gene_type:complete